MDGVLGACETSYGDGVKAVVFDTETNGLVENHTTKIERQPNVIEFYGCLVDLSTGEIEEEFDTLIRPPSAASVTEKITQITGIDYDQHLKDAPLVNEVFPKIARLLETAPMVIAHNLSFDIEMINLEAERLGIRIEWPIKKLCTVEASVYLKGYRLDLANLHQILFNEPFVGAHRAKSDVMANLRCAVEMYKRGMI